MYIHGYEASGPTWCDGGVSKGARDTVGVHRMHQVASSLRIVKNLTEVEADRAVRQASIGLTGPILQAVFSLETLMTLGVGWKPIY